MKRHKFFVVPDAICDADARLSNEDFRAAMKALSASLDIMAECLGIARRLVASYRKDKPIPKSVAMATKHLLARAAEIIESQVTDRDRISAPEDKQYVTFLLPGTTAPIKIPAAYLVDAQRA